MSRVRPKTKAPAPKAKLADPRNEALQRMTKAELLKTVKTLDARVTKLLNRVHVLEGEIVLYTSKPCTLMERAMRGCTVQDNRLPAVSPVASPVAELESDLRASYGGKFPWEQ